MVVVLVAGECSLSPLLMYAWSPTSRTEFWAMFASLVGAKVIGPGYFTVYRVRLRGKRIICILEVSFVSPS